MRRLSLKATTSILCVACALLLAIWFLAPKTDVKAEQRMVLEQSDTLILYSLMTHNELDSYFSSLAEVNGFIKNREKFHRNYVVGKVRITDSRTKAKLVKALYDGIESHNGFAAACFNPHHGLRATKGNRIVDVVICFECSIVYFRESNQKRGEGTSGLPKPIFDGVLNDAKVPRLPKRF
ncbi:MAG TPA: hypothetical protein VGB77_06310 [Abditibacteriaceae bacterium]|jgi:hypothetical protein